MEAPPGRSAAEFLGAVQQRVGEPLQREAMQASVRALYATGEFADVRVLAYPAPGGVQLVFATRPNYFLAEVQVNGGPGPQAAELEDASGLVLGSLYTPQALDQAKAAILRRLRSYGYYQARVSAQVHLDGQTAEAKVQLQIAAGAVCLTGDIAFSGATGFPAAVLLRASHLRQGQPATSERIADALTRLQTFYAAQGRLAAQISLAGQQFEPRRNEMNLKIAISAGPLVTVSTEGMALSAGVLRAQVPIYEEHAADLELVEEGQSNLENYLQQQGYFQAKVNFTRRAAGNALRIVYLIEPGPRETLEQIDFTGNHYFSSADLDEQLQLHVTTGWPSFLPGAHGSYSAELAQEDAAAITRLYRNNGFEDVQVTPLVRRDFRGKLDHIGVTFQIEEGAQSRVGQVRIIGASARQAAALRELLRTRPQQPYAPATTASDRTAILTYFYNAGYQQAQCTVETADADPAPGADTPPVAEVTFRIEPGAEETIHQVLITGYDHVHRSFIAQRLALAPGQPLSQLALLDSQRALYNTGLFTSASVVVRNQEGSERAKDVYVSVQEAERYTFSEGVGLQVQGGTGGAARDILGSTGYSPLLSFDVTRNAVGGRDQTLALRSTYGTLEKRALLSYDIPQFLNHRRWQAEVNTFYDDTFDVRTFRAISEQAGVQFTEALNPYAGWDYDLDFRRVRVLSPQVAPQQIPILSQPVEVAEFAATYHRDHRDNPVDTHRGNFNSLQMAIAKSYGPGFADFSRLDFENHSYYPLGASGNVVLARSTRVGVALPFGPKAETSITNPVTGVTTTSTGYLLPLPERFLGGGSDSLRGFSINQAGPRDPITGFPVGGDALLVNNVELRFPLLGTAVGGVLFYDLGNVYTTPEAMLRSLTRLHPDVAGDFTSHTVGVGLRYDTPVGPVRVDFGYLLNPPTFQYFSTGTPAEVLEQRLPAFHFFLGFGQTY
ncbi:MAG: POTRA domain-containing protein [Terriglobales bacterium]